MQCERPNVDVLMTTHVPIIYDDDIRWVSNWCRCCHNQRVWCSYCAGLRALRLISHLTLSNLPVHTPLSPPFIGSLSIRYNLLVSSFSCWARTGSPNVGEHDFCNQNWLWLDVEYTAQPHSHRS